MPSPSMFIMAIDVSTCCVSGSGANWIMPISARTVAWRLLDDDGPTSTVTSNLARLMSF